MNLRLLAPLAAVAALLITGCGGGSAPAAPTPGPTCGPTGLTTALVYPAPGSTGVSDSTTQMVIATSPAIASNTLNLYLAGSGGFSGYTANLLVSIGANQLPTGSAPATFANPNYYSVQLQQGFPTGTHITTVALNNPFSNCTPMTIPGASFTTQ